MTARYIAQSANVAARLLGDEMILMSTRDSILFTLSPVATEIWLAADGRTPLQEIVERRVCARFEVTPEAALRDAEAFVEELVRRGVLLVSDQPIADAG